MKRVFKPRSCENCGLSFIPRTSRTRWCEDCCTRNCLVCDKEFRADPAEIKRGRGKHCSKDCAGMSKHLAGTYERICEQCGKKFRVKKYFADNHGVGKYCSNECVGKANVGEGNARFKGYVSVTHNGYLIYTPSHPKYPRKYVHNVKWRKANPNAKCADCGGEVEHVHHIDRNKLNNDLKNLVGLCNPCHRKRHTKENDAKAIS